MTDGIKADTQTEDLEAKTYEQWKENMELLRRVIDEKPDEVMLMLCDLALEEKEGEDVLGLSKIYRDVASVIRHKLTGEVACRKESEFWNLTDFLRDEAPSPHIYGFNIFNKPCFQWTPRGGVFTRPPGINEIAKFFFGDSFERSLHHPIACICRMVFEGVPVNRRDEKGVFERLPFDHPDVVLMACLGRDSMTVDTVSFPSWIKNYWFRSSDVAAHKIFFNGVEWGEERDVVDTLRNSYHRHIFPNGIPATTIHEEKLVLEREVQYLKRCVKALENANSTGEQKAGDVTAKVEEKPLGDRERDNLLRIIAVMLELLRSPRSSNTTESEIIDEMLANYDDMPGIKKRTLEEKFAMAKRALSSK